MNPAEQRTWVAFKDLNYKTIVKTILPNFNELECNMSAKFHSLRSYIDFCPAYLDNVTRRMLPPGHQRLGHKIEGQVKCKDDDCLMRKRDDAGKGIKSRKKSSASRQKEVVKVKSTKKKN